MVPLSELRFTARSTGLLVSLFLAGCSLINAPDEIDLGNGGGPPTTGGSPSTGGSGGGGGAPPACTVPEDCESLTTECATGDCVDGACVAVPQPAATPCGPEPHDSCDVADACDGNGTCVDNFVADGTYCDDCAAGLGNCALCQGGLCGNCDMRASLKTFRAPLSASGWTFTGGWGVYAKTPPAQLFSYLPRCMDGVDNDGDTLIDFPDDPSCISQFDDETTTARCGNGFDDDSDALIDLNDPGCESAADDTENEPPIEFDHPVLGTDGNRRRPYNWGGGELEDSSATSPATRIPATLEFLSWHLDEGLFYDLKAVQLSLDGNSFTSLAICPPGPTAPYVFCEPRAQRTADDWDVISLPVPVEFANQIGYVRFKYDTGDGCCDFERGWYIDALNFATDCACNGQSDCAYLDSGCSTGTCDSTGECFPAAANVGDACTPTTSTTADCSTPTCTSNGLCETNGDELDGIVCDDCPDGPGLCEFCVQASCVDCPDLQRFNDTTGDVLYNERWVFEGDWNFNSCITPNSVTNTEYLCFSSTGLDPFSDPHVPPSLGNDGSRVYGTTPPTSEIENASFRTPNTVIPATLDFRSWHQDRGGNDTFNLRDKKRIRVSTDNGNTWMTVLDCDGNTTVPFCQPWPAFTNRTVDDWDDVSLPISNSLIGEIGMFEFNYDTVDQGQGWERGWRIDDMNIARCD